MEIKIRGIDNSRPKLFTYELSDKPVSEAVATKTPGVFKLSHGLETPAEYYALVDQQQKFVGMVIRRYSPRAKSHQASLMSFMKEWLPKTRYNVHTCKLVDEQLDY